MSLFLLLVAVIVGVIVALDVTGYEISVLGIQNESPWRRALRHACWHGGFLAAGVGIFEVVGGLLKKLFHDFLPWFAESFDFAWLKSWAEWMQGAPRYIMAGFGILLFVLLYLGKLKRAASGEEDEEEGGDGLPRIFRWVRRLGAEHVSCVMVALDMWYLTPLLKSMIEGHEPLEKCLFVATVFATVFGVCVTVVTQGRKFLGAQMSVGALAWVLTTLVFLEPLGAGYFAARTGFIVFGIEEMPAACAGISFTLLVVLTWAAGFSKICDAKRREAEELVAPQPTAAGDEV